MIASAAEFIRLRQSVSEQDCERATYDEAPLDVWWDLILNHSDMKVWAVHSKTVPVAILEALAADSDAAVRDAIARKRKTPPELLRLLAHDPDSGVRYAVACNEKTPRAVLESLLADEWETIASKAKSRLDEASTS